METIYNKHFHDQHIKEWFDEKELIHDEFLQISYQKKLKGQKEIFDLLDDHISIVHKDNILFDEDMDKIFDTLSERSNVIVTNHATFANIPILIRMIDQEAKKRGINNITNRCFTVLGPTILTQVQRNVILSISNAVKTIPNTVFGNIEWMEKEINIVRKKFLRTYIKLLEEKWNIIFMNPQWTRDIINWSKCHDCPKPLSILTKNDKTLATSIKLVQSAAKKWSWITIIWVNDAGLKTPWKTNEKDNSWTTSKIFIGSKSFQKEEILGIISRWELMSILWNLTHDHNGDSIWYSVSEKQFEELRNLLE